MRTLKRILRPLAIAALTMLPDTLHAQTAGAVSLYNLLVSQSNSFMPLWTAAGSLVLVIAGFTLMISQDEGAISKAKTAIIAVVVGGAMIAISPTFIDALYHPGVIALPPFSLAIELESLGFASWMAAIAATAGVIVVIVTVIRAVASFGDEDSYAKARSSLMYAAFGLLMIGAGIVIQNTFFGLRTPAPLIAFVFLKLSLVLIVIVLIAVAIIVYAGIWMIVNFGNEEYFTYGKSLLIRAIIGLCVVSASYALVNFVLNLFVW